MKKFIALLLTLAMVFAFTACGSSDGGGDSSGEAKTIVIGTEAVPESITGGLLEAFKSELEENSGGSLTVDIQYSGVLGGEAEMVEQVKMGTLDMVLPGSTILASYDDRCQVFDIPFLFKDGQAVVDAYNGGLAEYYNGWLEEAGFHCFGVIPTGARGLSNSKHEVKTPEDMKGLKIRVMDSPLYVDLFNALGANTVTMSYSDIYGALQQGVIDGQDNPAEFTLASGFSDLNKYYTRLQHIICVMPVVMSKDTYDGLSDDQKAIVDAAAKTMVDNGVKEYADTEEGFYKEMAENGNEITELSDDERAAFAEKAADVKAKYSEALDQEVLDLIDSFNK